MIQITRHNERGGNRGYDSVEERDTDIERLRTQGFNHFVMYHDTQAEIALLYSKVEKSVASSTMERPWSPKPGNRGYDLLC